MHLTGNFFPIRNGNTTNVFRAYCDGCRNLNGRIEKRGILEQIGESMISFCCCCKQEYSIQHLSLSLHSTQSQQPKTHRYKKKSRNKPPKIFYGTSQAAAAGANTSVTLVPGKTIGPIPLAVTAPNSNPTSGKLN